jgi:hypothetical protein
MTAAEYEKLLMQCETTRLQFPPDGVQYGRIKKREAAKCAGK